MEIISVGNELSPPQCGTLLRFEPITKANVMTPVFWSHTFQQEYLGFSIILPYSNELWEHLHTIPRKDLWKYCSTLPNQIK
jgi:hypothetical protein